MSKTHDIKVTPLFTKINNAFNTPGIRGVVLEGGSRSSKSYSLGQYTFVRGFQCPKQRMLLARLRYAWMRNTIIPTMKDVSATFGNIKQVKNPFTFTWNESEIQMIGLDDPQKSHGAETGFFWLNEGIEIQKENFNQLEQRQVSGGQWAIDYNPSTDEHWIYDELLRRDDVAYIHSTYLDNPFISDEALSKILGYEPTEYNIGQGTADLYNWEVYGLGKRSRRQGVVFTNWAECKEMPETYQWKCTGLDFGFTNHPSALIDVRFFDGEIWLDELFYETGMSNIYNEKMSEAQKNKTIQKRLEDLQYTRENEIIADGAEPKSVHDIKVQGFRVYGTGLKHKITPSLEKMKEYKINITERSVNLIKEFRNYSWKKDTKTGKYGHEAEDNWNHAIDASRYVIERKLFKKGSGVYHIH